MNRTVLFNSPFLLGFERLEQLLERTAKSGVDGYPPYNIEQSNEDKLRITLAVAGFGREELNVTVEDRQLIIRGKQSENADKNFLHRGIAARQFQRAFVLAEGIEVTGASLENGLLSIDLERPKSNTIVRTIDIRTGRPETKRSVP
jgi:HSP20 family molecular chaperone IbpA